MRTHSSPRRLSMTALGILFIAAMIFPAYWMVNTSFQNASSAGVADIFPFHPTLAGYQTAFTDQYKNLLTSLIIAFGTVVVTLGIATPAAYALGHFRLPGGPGMLMILLITQMVPSIVIANALYSLFNSLHLLNSYLGLILANGAGGIPFAILLIRAFMSGIPKELVEAAQVDGASDFRAFRSIVVPISKNAIVTAGLFAFLGGWGDFLLALTLTSTPDVRPITLGIYNYMNSTTISWGPIMATAVLASIPAGILLVFAQKYIAVGALGGALK